MVTIKNKKSIKDFFKPFAQPKIVRKRSHPPSSDDDTPRKHLALNQSSDALDGTPPVTTESSNQFSIKSYDLADDYTCLRRSSPADLAACVTKLPTLDHPRQDVAPLKSATSFVSSVEIPDLKSAQGHEPVSTEHRESSQSPRTGGLSEERSEVRHHTVPPTQTIRFPLQDYPTSSLTDLGPPTPSSCLTPLPSRSFTSMLSSPPSTPTVNPDLGPNPQPTLTELLDDSRLAFNGFSHISSPGMQSDSSLTPLPTQDDRIEMVDLSLSQEMGAQDSPDAKSSMRSEPSDERAMPSSALPPSSAISARKASVDGHDYVIDSDMEEDEDFESILADDTLKPKAQDVEAESKLLSDTESLDDLDDVLQIHRPKSLTELEHADRRTSLRQATAKVQASISAELKPYKPRFSLKALAKQQKALDKSKATISEAKAALEPDLGSDAVETNEGIHNDLLLRNFAELSDQTDNMHRIQAAIGATEALHSITAWTFLDSIPEAPPKEPSICDLHVPRNLSFIRDKQDLQEAIYTGLLAAALKRAVLPTEFVAYLLQKSILHASKQMQCALISTLQTCPAQLEICITDDWVDKAFRQHGASRASLNIESAIMIQNAFEGAPSSKRNSSGSISCLVKTLAAVSGALTQKRRIRILLILCRAMLDSKVATCRDLCPIMQQALVKLLAVCIIKDPDFSPNQEILVPIYAWTTSPSLRSQLLKSLPTTDPRWHSLRRQLALAFFYNDTSYLIQPSTQSPAQTISSTTTIRSSPPQFSIPALIDHLHKDESYRPTKQIDYIALSAQISILDIAIGNVNPIERACQASSPVTISTSSIKSFNISIDALASEIKSTFMRLIDSGSSKGGIDPSRSEAKEIVEQVQSRLMYTVRTQPPPMKKMLFNASNMDTPIVSFLNGMHAPVATSQENDPQTAVEGTLKTSEPDGEDDGDEEGDCVLDGRKGLQQFLARAKEQDRQRSLHVV